MSSLTPEQQRKLEADKRKRKQYLIDSIHTKTQNTKLFND